MAFPSTRWSMVESSRAATTAGRAALGELCERYRLPLVIFARRRVGDPDEARELVQDFFADLLGRGGFATVEHGRGRFRSYLLGAFCHHVARTYQRERADKRGRGRTVSLDDEVVARAAQAVADDADPERAYAKAWALAVVARVEDVLAQQYAARGQAAGFAALRPHLRGEGPPYAETARLLGTSEAALKVAVHRLRQRFGQVLRAEVVDTLADPGDLEAEIRTLIAALGPGGSGL